MEFFVVLIVLFIIALIFFNWKHNRDQNKYLEKIKREHEELISSPEYKAQLERNRGEYEKRMHSSMSSFYDPPDWYERRSFVLDRDNDQCISCGGSIGLQVHHKVPRTVGIDHSVDNLVTLCVYCHSKVHDRNFVPSAIELKLSRLNKSGIKPHYFKRKARKPHSCHECGKCISEGTAYYHRSGMKRGSIWNVKLCQKCFLAYRLYEY